MRLMLLLVGLSIIALSGCSLFGLFSDTKLPTQNIVLQTVSGEETELTVEIADDSSERAKGLVNREELDSDAGMLFIFEDEEPRYFWMKDTLIPLDIIFFDSDKKVVRIIENMQPCLPPANAPGEAKNCLTYFSQKPAKYALEINAGFVKERRISTEDKLLIE